MQSLERVTGTRTVRLVYDVSDVYRTYRSATRRDVAAGTAFALLVALAGASRAGRDEPDELGAALAGVGDSEGESWLNLLGIPLDAGAPFTAERLVEAVESMDAVELRRHLLGRYAWSWCTLAGIDDIEVGGTW